MKNSLMSYISRSSAILLFAACTTSAIASPGKVNLLSLSTINANSSLHNASIMLAGPGSPAPMPIKGLSVTPRLVAGPGSPAPMPIKGLSAAPSLSVAV